MAQRRLPFGEWSEEELTAGLPPPPRLSHAGQQQPLDEDEPADGIPPPAYVRADGWVDTRPYKERLAEKLREGHGRGQRHRAYADDMDDLPAGRRGGPPQALLIVAGVALLLALFIVVIPNLLGRAGVPGATPGALPTTIPSSAADGLAGQSVTITPTTSLPAGAIMLPAMDDASMQETNGALIHLDAQPAVDLHRWGGATGALCQVKLLDDRQPWVPCWRLGLPNATPAPTATPRPYVPPPPPPPTATPAPPCYDASGFNGTAHECGWDPGLQQTVQAIAGPPLATPVPTICVASNDGSVTQCGTDYTAVQKYANEQADTKHMEATNQAATAAAQTTHH